ncbi:MAG: nucleoid-associated protein [Armatimonadetes bacterium]|nr:nucleoid-associated protein [Armatimonadota bacterium]
MKSLLSTLQIEKVIVHKVPARFISKPSDEVELGLSEVECELTTDIKNYFCERIKSSLSNAASGVVFDDTANSLMPNTIFNFLGDGKAPFVEYSHTMTKHLYECQNGVNPAGLLTVVEGELDGIRALSILKLEQEVALRLEQTQIAGKSTFNLRHLRDLMLGEQTKVFKVGLFVQRGNELCTIDGLVSDKQRSLSSKGGIADFFLRKYLGCKFKEDPEVTTQRFYELTGKFINEEVSDPLKKAKYEIALLSELNSTISSMRPEIFAQRHLDTADRQPYTDWLEAHQFRDAPFEKNTVRIEKQLTRMQLSFASGVTVLGPPSVIDERVKMTELPSGNIKVEFEDKLKQVQGKR